MYLIFESFTEIHTLKGRIAEYSGIISEIKYCIKIKVIPG